MPQASYDTRRDQLQTYFDDTAVDAWKRLTSEAPVSGIRATVRACSMRAAERARSPSRLQGAVRMSSVWICLPSSSRSR